MTNEMEIQDELQASTENLPFRSETTLTSWVANPYLRAATSDNTRKAYQGDIRHYEQWGGLLPATPEIIINYLQVFATRLNTRTLARRLVAIRQWHSLQGFPDPTVHPVVVKTMVGITRVHGKPRIKAPALSPEDLQKMVNALSVDATLLNIRDNAMLQIGYFGALRRSEIISIHHEHISWQEEGIEILLPSSKTDQVHEGQYCAIPRGNDMLCPVRALEDWLEKSAIRTGAVFRRIMKNQVVGNEALTPLSVNDVIHRCATLAGLASANEITPHSLRRGLATSAASANASIKTIMRAGRWKQVNTVMEYIEAGERFSENAAASVLQKMAGRTKLVPDETG